MHRNETFSTVLIFRPLHQIHNLLSATTDEQTDDLPIICSVCTKTELLDFSPQANYTDRATAACL
jgi:hypothetical protein